MTKKVTDAWLLNQQLSNAQERIRPHKILSLKTELSQSLNQTLTLGAKLKGHYNLDNMAGHQTIVAPAPASMLGANDTAAIMIVKGNTSQPSAFTHVHIRLHTSNRRDIHMHK